MLFLGSMSFLEDLHRDRKMHLLGGIENLEETMG
jgi:hypothetical protein